MKETREMMEILHQNKLKAQKRDLIERKQQKKDHTKKELLKIAGLVVLAIILLFITLKVMTNALEDDYKACVSQHGETYCQAVSGI